MNEGTLVGYVNEGTLVGYEGYSCVPSSCLSLVLMTSSLADV